MELNKIDSSINLQKKEIEFNQLIETLMIDFEPESIESDDNQLHDKIKTYASTLLYRFNKIYNLNVLNFVDGYETLLIECKDNDELLIKSYLHTFLTFKDRQGGENANSDGSASLFEKISANSVKNFLGSNSECILVGEKQKKLTLSHIQEIAAKMNERVGVSCNLPKKAQDDGVDFIVYKNFDSRNIGNLIILGQASVGKNFQNKKPINNRWREEYFTLFVKPPITLLSTVQYLENEQLRQIGSDFHNALIFDRGRILKYFDATDETLNNELINFLNNNINEKN